MNLQRARSRCLAPRAVVFEELINKAAQRNYRLMWRREKATRALTGRAETWLSEMGPCTLTLFQKHSAIPSGRQSTKHSDKNDSSQYISTLHTLSVFVGGILITPLCLFEMQRVIYLNAALFALLLLTVCHFKDFTNPFQHMQKAKHVLLPYLAHFTSLKR